MRPPEFLDDVRLRELEMTAAEARLASLDYQLCPHCDYEIQADYLRCPSCMRKLKERCYSCGKPIDPTWRMCPLLRGRDERADAVLDPPPAPPDDGPGDRGPRHARRDRGEAEAERRGRRRILRRRPLRRCSPAATPRSSGHLCAMERTLILVKPDAFARGLTGEIIARFERKGLRIVPCST